MTRMPSFGFGSAMPAMPDPWMQMQSQAQERQRKKKEKKQIEPISDEESNSLLSWAMGGLEAVGNVLDLPSSSIRDVVAGENPFDQWMHPISSENRTTGRDLLRQWNMADKEDTWGNFLGGLGVEIASDLPLMMLTTPFSAVKAGAKGAQAGLKIAESLTDDVTKAAGKAVAGGTDDAAVAAFQQATKAGSRPIDFLPNNPAAMADQMRRGERGLIGLRNPLTNQPIATFTGESLGLNKGAASLLENMFYGGNRVSDITSAPIRAVRSLFSHSASGPGTWTMSGAAQRAMDLRSAEKESLLAALDNVMPVMAERRKGILDEFTKLAEHHGMEGDQLAFNDFMRSAVEAKNLPDPENISLRIREALEIGGDAPMEHADNLAQEVSQYMNGMIQIKDTVRQRVAAMGGDTAELDDMFSRHFPRRGKHLDLMDTGEGRKDIFKDVPGGAVTINRLSRDPIVTSIFKPKNKELVGEAIKRSELERAAAYKEKVNAARKWLEGQQLDLTGVNTNAEILDTYAYRRYIDPELRMATANGPIVVGEGKKAVTHTYESLRDSWIARGKDAKGNKLKPRISELRQYLGKQSDAVLPKGVFGHTEIEDWHDYVTSLLGQESTLRTARHMLTERGVIKEAVEGAEPGYTSLANAWEKAGFKPHGLTSLIQEAGMDVKSIDNLTIPQSMASSLKSYADALKPSTHKEMGKLVRQWDRTMALYRGMLTTPWPSFHARNLISGTFQAATHGKIPMRDVLAGEYKAIAYLHGNKDAMKFLHEVETSDILKGHGWLADTFGDVGAESASRMPTSLREVFAPWKGALSKNWNPLNMRGVRNHVDDVAEAARKGKPIVEKQPWYAEAGENLYGAVEFVLRAGYYESLREKGFSAAAAKYYVKQAHFDYSKLSKFEKNVARRGSLFYCVPIDSQILTKAGWKNYDELKIGEEVLGYDIESHRQKWTTVEDVAVFDYDGILMSINKQQGNFQWLFTPNHRWPVRARSDGKRGDVRKMVKGYQLRSNHAVPYTAPLDEWPKQSLLTVREAAIIGWLITDGHIGTKKRRWTWAIYQSPKKFAQEIRDLLGDDCLGESIHPDSGVIQFRLSKSLRDHLSSLGFSNRKDAINIVGKLDKASAEAMWEAMYKADGDICHPRNSHHFACIKQDVFDVAQMLVQLLGMKIQQGGRGGYISKDRTWCKLSDPYKNGYSTIGSQWYKGKIWCPRTGTGTWVMRRNGKVIITGNTWRRKSVPHSLLVLAERPGGAKAQAIRAINRATQGDTYTPQYLKESVSIPVGQNEEGNTTYLRQGGLPLEDLNMLALRGSTLGTVKRTAEKLVSQTNPLLTGAIESLTGRQMYTGRQVKDLASRTEKVMGEPWPLVDRTLALSPVSRVIGEGEKAAGILGLRETGRSLPMNLANALSGLYFTTPDAEKWKLLDASNALRERLEEEPMTRESVRPYVPSKYKDMVSPEVEDMLKRLHELELLQRKQRDKKKTSS